MASPTSKHVTVGTSGHIDHGKTTLVQALTGKDTDRLKEEKARGITIALGFAELELPSGQSVSLIDVPGHERFVKTMVSGAGGIDIMLLVVAADEGIMPQTREHIEICQRLGVAKAVVALTKIDQCDAELAMLAELEVAEYLGAHGYENVEVVACSAKSGVGLDALRGAIERAAADVAPRDGDSFLSMPIDRAFTVKGFGCVVTGTVLSGHVRVGDAVELIPAGLTSVVRTIERFDRPAEAASAGDRAALSLPGLSADAINVGQMVVAEGVLRQTGLIDTEIHIANGAEASLHSSAKVMVHIGSASTNAQVTLLNRDVVGPGERAFARIRMQRPIAAFCGQRFILRGFRRTSGLGRTLGGGRILDSDPPRRPRHLDATLEVLTILQAYSNGSTTPQAVIYALAREAGLRGILPNALAVRAGLKVDGVVQAAEGDRRLHRFGDRLYSDEACAALAARLEPLVSAHFAARPHAESMTLRELEGKLPRATAPLAERAAKTLVARGILERAAGGFRPAGHDPTRTKRLERALEEALSGAGLRPPAPPTLAATLGMEPGLVSELLGRLARQERVVRISAAIYLSAKHYEHLKLRVSSMLRSEGELTTAQIKSALDLPRKYLIPMLEALDRNRVTVRVGEARRVI